MPHLEEWARPLAALGYSIRALQIDATDWVAWPRNRLPIPAAVFVSCCGRSLRVSLEVSHIFKHIPPVRVSLADLVRM